MNKQAARIFILDDDSRRHNWFTKHLSDSHVNIASDVSQARKLLSTNSYDAIFLDHDLLPEHYGSEEYDDESTGYAIASWLSANPTLQQTSNITIHTRNADAALRMVEELRYSGRLAAYVPFPLLTNRIKQLVSHRNYLDAPFSTHQFHISKRSAIGVPHYAEYLLRLLLPAKYRETVIGDMYEEYAEIEAMHGVHVANNWYLKQVVTSIGPLIWKALRWENLALLWAELRRII